MGQHTSYRQVEANSDKGNVVDRPIDLMLAC